MGKISIEREIFLFNKSAGSKHHDNDVDEGTNKQMVPCSPDQVQVMMNQLQTFGYDVVKEVAQNSIEVRFSFICPDDVGKLLQQYRNDVEKIAKQNNLTVVYTSIGEENLNPSSYDRHFLASDFFPNMKPYWVNTISTQIHFQCSKEEASDIYKALMMISPYFIMSAHQIRRDWQPKLLQMLSPLHTPWNPTCMDEFDRQRQYASNQLYQQLTKRFPDRQIISEIKNRFPTYINSNNKLILPPNDFFTYARIRPDLELSNGDISVEFRPIDGYESLEQELEAIKIAIRVRHANIKEIATLYDVNSIIQFMKNPNVSSPAYQTALHILKKVCQEQDHDAPGTVIVEKNTKENMRLSLEREFFLFNQHNHAPCTVSQIDQIKLDLEQKRYDVTYEVAINCLEVRFGFILPDDIARVLNQLRKDVEAICSSQGVYAVWTSIDSKQPNPQRHQGLFSSEFFQDLKAYWLNTGSTQIHFECSPQECLDLYKALFVVSPYFFYRSIQNDIRKNAQFSLWKLFGILYEPLSITSLESFDDFRKNASALLLKDIASRFPDCNILEEFRPRFPKCFDKDGMFSLAVNDIVSIVRIRPDLKRSNGNISVEFRAIDGCERIEDEIQLVQIVAAIRYHSNLESILSKYDPSALHAFYQNPSEQSPAYLEAERILHQLKLIHMYQQ